MKNFILLLVTFLFCQSIYAQSESQLLKKQLTSIDAGILGAWINHERHLGGSFTLNTQLGFDGSLYGGSGDFNYLLIPRISVAPRFYYNIHKRLEKGKRTANNSANYLEVLTSFYPDLFEITNDEAPGRMNYDQAITFIPKWGLRRAIGQHFKFDFSVGYGIGIQNKELISGFDLDLSVGYVFGK